MTALLCLSPTDNSGTDIPFLVVVTCCIA